MTEHAQWRTRLPRSYNARKVHEDVMLELGRMRTELAELVDDVRTQELDRLDRMLLGVWDRASHGDPHAITNVLAIMARRARYLPGLEGPVTIAPTNVDGTASYGEGPAEVTDEYVTNVAALLAQYGLYEAHTNGEAASASNGTEGFTPQ